MSPTGRLRAKWYRTRRHKKNVRMIQDATRELERVLLEELIAEWAESKITATPTP